MPEPIDSPIVQALRALTGRNLFPQAPPPSQPVNAPFAPPASSWAEVQADPLKALANLVMGAVDPWGQPKGMNTGSIGGLLGAALPLASLARGAEAGVAARGAQAARGAEDAAPGIRAYHASRHDFDRFNSAMIGEGEGTQITGHGLYFGSHQQPTEYYREIETPYAMVRGRAHKAALASNELTHSPDEYAAYAIATDGDWGTKVALESLDNEQIFTDRASAEAAKSLISSGQVTPMPRRMYEVSIAANPEQLLQWNAPLSQQGPSVRAAVMDLLSPLEKANPSAWERVKNGSITGKDAYAWISGERMLQESGFVHPSQLASESLRSKGVPGIQVNHAQLPLDAMRYVPDGSNTYVIFDDSLISILKKYGVALPMIEALRRKAAANNWRLPAADVHGAIQS